MLERANKFVNYELSTIRCGLPSGRFVRLTATLYWILIKKGRACLRNSAGDQHSASGGLQPPAVLFPAAAACDPASSSIEVDLSGLTAMRTSLPGSSRRDSTRSLNDSHTMKIWPLPIVFILGAATGPAGSGSPSRSARTVRARLSTGARYGRPCPADDSAGRRRARRRAG